MLETRLSLAMLAEARWPPSEKVARQSGRLGYIHIR